jgi:NAD(P)-dependent dehydrogenase (short-subunit alcohol dehydrogenase family)
MTLKDKTLFVSGGSRGVGLEIGQRAARDGANVALIAKAAGPNPRLAGTVYTAAEQIEAGGGHAPPIVRDIADESAVAAAVVATVGRFGGIDACVNNASALNLSGGDVPVSAAIADPSSLLCPWRRVLQRPHTSPRETVHIDHQPTVAQDFRSERNPAPRGAHAGNR